MTARVLRCASRVRTVTLHPGRLSSLGVRYCRESCNAGGESQRGSIRAEELTEIQELGEAHA